MKNITELIKEIPVVKLSYLNPEIPNKRIQLNESVEIFQVLRSSWDEDTIGFRETFKILLLNNANYMLGIFTVGEGGTAAVTVDTRLIFQAALVTNSTSLILCHNHPAGDPKPSMADMKLTRKIADAGQLLNIHVLDHFIITQDKFKYYAFSDEGLL